MKGKIRIGGSSVTPLAEERGKENPFQSRGEKGKKFPFQVRGGGKNNRPAVFLNGSSSLQQRKYSCK